MLATTSAQVRRASGAQAPECPRQKHVRLTRQQRAELIDRYRAGAFKKELARVYGIHVETVRSIIRRSMAV